MRRKKNKITLTNISYHIGMLHTNVHAFTNIRKYREIREMFELLGSLGEES